MAEAGWRSSRARPCPVCGRGDQSCLVREADGEIAFVLCRRVEGEGSSLLGDRWEWLKPIADGPGGSVVRPAEPEVEVVPVRRKADRPAVVALPEEVSSVDEQVAALQASMRRRHDGYAALLRGLPRMGRETRDLLTRERGLTPQQIDLFEQVLGARQIRRKERLAAAMGLPGFDNEGVYQGPAGILLPAIGSLDGEPCILGFQVAVAKHELVKGLAKYKSVSCGSAVEEARDPHYQSVLVDGPNGPIIETAPLFSCVLEERPATAICTDSSFKAFLVGVRHGVAGFGAPGMGYATRYGQLRKALAESVGLGGDVLIALDSGDGSNPGILASALQLCRQLDRDGFTARIWAPLAEALTEKTASSDIDDAPDALNRKHVISAPELLRRLPASVREKATSSASKTQRRGIRPQTVEDVLEVPWLEGQEPSLYEPGERTTAITEALGQGFRVVLDTSGTGAGKSHWAAHLRQDCERLGVTQALILTNSPYDQHAHFAEAGAPVALLRGRNAGIKRTPVGIRTMRTQDDIASEDLQLAGPNCARLEELVLYQSRSVGSLLSSLCGECVYAESCKVTTGMFMSDRQDAIDARVTIMHPNSLLETAMLGHTDANGESTSLVVLDDIEIGSLSQQVFVQSSLLSWTRSVVTSSVSLGLNGILKWLEGAALNAGTTGGLSTEALRREFEAKFGTRSASSISWTTAQLAETSAVIRAPEKVGALCWLESLRRWVTGDAAAWIDADGLHLQHWNRAVVDTLRAAKAVVLLDATGSAAVWGKLLRSEVSVIQQRQRDAGAEVTVRQITGVGRLGYTRNTAERFRLSVVLDHLCRTGQIDPNTAALVETSAGLKVESSKKVAATHLTWLGGSRGSNAAKACQSLVLVGTPSTNLGAAAGLFEQLYGRSVDIAATTSAVYPVLQVAGEKPMVAERTGTIDPEFRRWYQGHLDAAYTQAFGRLRSSIRSGEDGLEVIAITDASVPFPVQIVELDDLLGEESAEQVRNCSERNLRKAAMALAERGEDPTTANLAKAADLPEPLVVLWFEAAVIQPRWIKAARSAARKARLKSPKLSATDEQLEKSAGCDLSASSTDTVVDADRVVVLAA